MRPFVQDLAASASTATFASSSSSAAAVTVAATAGHRRGHPSFPRPGASTASVCPSPSYGRRTTPSRLSPPSTTAAARFLDLASIAPASTLAIAAAVAVAASLPARPRFVARFLAARARNTPADFLVVAPSLTNPIIRVWLDATAIPPAILFLLHVARERQQGVTAGVAVGDRGELRAGEQVEGAQGERRHLPRT